MAWGEGEFGAADQYAARVGCPALLREVLRVLVPEHTNTLQAWLADDASPAAHARVLSALLQAEEA